MPCYEAACTTHSFVNCSLKSHSKGSDHIIGCQDGQAVDMLWAWGVGVGGWDYAAGICLQVCFSW